MAIGPAGFGGQAHARTFPGFETIKPAEVWREETGFAPVPGEAARVQKMANICVNNQLPSSERHANYWRVPRITEAQRSILNETAHHYTDAQVAGLAFADLVDLSPFHYRSFSK